MFALFHQRRRDPSAPRFPRRDAIIAAAKAPRRIKAAKLRSLVTPEQAFLGFTDRGLHVLLEVEGTNVVVIFKDPLGFASRVTLADAMETLEGFRAYYFDSSPRMGLLVADRLSSRHVAPTFVVFHFPRLQQPDPGLVMLSRRYCQPIDDVCRQGTRTYGDAAVTVFATFAVAVSVSTGTSENINATRTCTCGSALCGEVQHRRIAMLDALGNTCLPSTRTPAPRRRGRGAGHARRHLVLRGRAEEGGDVREADSNMEGEQGVEGRRVERGMQRGFRDSNIVAGAGTSQQLQERQQQQQQQQQQTQHHREVQSHFRAARGASRASLDTDSSTNHVRTPRRGGGRCGEATEPEWQLPCHATHEAGLFNDRGETRVCTVVDRPLLVVERFLELDRTVLAFALQHVPASHRLTSIADFDCLRLGPEAGTQNVVLLASVVACVEATVTVTRATDCSTQHTTGNQPPSTKAATAPPSSSALHRTTTTSSSPSSSTAPHTLMFALCTICWDLDRNHVETQLVQRFRGVDRRDSPVIRRAHVAALHRLKAKTKLAPFSAVCTVEFKRSLQRIWHPRRPTLVSL